MYFWITSPYPKTKQAYTNIAASLTNLKQYYANKVAVVLSLVKAHFVAIVNDETVSIKADMLLLREAFHDAQKTINELHNTVDILKLNAVKLSSELENMKKDASQLNTTVDGLLTSEPTLFKLKLF